MLKIMRQPERRQVELGDLKDEGLVVCGGKVWRTLNAMVSAYGISDRRVVKYRERNCGEELQQIVDHFLAIGKAFAPTPELEAKNLAVRYRGDFYRSWVSVAVHNGISKNQYDYAMKKCDGDGRKAVETLVGPDYEPDYDLNFDPDFKPAA